MTKRPQFTKEFEREAVRLAETSGWPRKEVAEDLGIDRSTLTRWLARNRDAVVDDPARGDTNADMSAETLLMAAKMPISNAIRDP